MKNIRSTEVSRVLRVFKIISDIDVDSHINMNENEIQTNLHV